MKEFIKNNETKLRELVRFGIVGVLATAIHYGIYYLLSLSINLNVAYTIGYVCSFIINFILSNKFTFKTKPTVKKGFGFMVSHLINYLLHMGLFNLYLYLGIDENIAPLFVYIVAVPVNFLLVRFALTSKKLS